MNKFIEKYWKLINFYYLCRKKVKKIYHPYWLWEEFISGMWRKETIEYEQANFENIVQFTGNHEIYGDAMLEVIENWQISCEDKLSNISLNRKAWLGHAACCYKHGYPEYLVRKAWGTLTENQRELANNKANEAIKLWEQKQKSKAIREFGKKGVMPEVFQMKRPQNWKQMTLFPLIVEYAELY
jgi:hypothetical protein